MSRPLCYCVSRAVCVTQMLKLKMLIFFASEREEREEKMRWQVKWQRIERIKNQESRIENQEEEREWQQQQQPDAIVRDIKIRFVSFAPLCLPSSPRRREEKLRFLPPIDSLFFFFFCSLFSLVCRKELARHGENSKEGRAQQQQ